MQMTSATSKANSSLISLTGGKGKLLRRSQNQSSFRLGGSMLTRSVGTKLYASPEQLASSIYNYKTDIYSLGIIILRLLTPTYTQMETLRFVEKARAGTFRDSFAEYFEECAEVIKQMMLEDPTKRPDLEEIEKCLVLQEMKLFKELRIQRESPCFKVFLQNNKFGIGIHTNILIANILVELEINSKPCMLLLQGGDVLVMFEGESKSRMMLTLEEYTLVLHPKKKLAGLKSNLRVDISLTFPCLADLELFESWGVAQGCLVY